MKPWKCRTCSAWNNGRAKRCAACKADRARVGVVEDARKAARLAAVCAAVPGLASVFADIARAMRSHAAYHELDVRGYNPETVVTPCGKVIVELNPAA